MNLQILPMSHCETTNGNTCAKSLMGKNAVHQQLTCLDFFLSSFFFKKIDMRGLMVIPPVCVPTNVQPLVHQSELNHWERHKGDSVLQLTDEATALAAH